MHFYDEFCWSLYTSPCYTDFRTGYAKKYVDIPHAYRIRNLTLQLFNLLQFYGDQKRRKWRSLIEINRNLMLLALKK